MNVGKHARTVRHLTPVQASAVGGLYVSASLLCCFALVVLDLFSLLLAEVAKKPVFVQDDKDRSTTRRNLMQT